MNGDTVRSFRPIPFCAKQEKSLSFRLKRNNLLGHIEFLGEIIEEGKPTRIRSKVGDLVIDRGWLQSHQPYKPRSSSINCYSDHFFSVFFPLLK